MCGRNSVKANGTSAFDYKIAGMRVDIPRKIQIAERLYHYRKAQGLVERIMHIQLTREGYHYDKSNSSRDLHVSCLLDFCSSPSMHPAQHMIVFE